MKRKLLGGLWLTNVPQNIYLVFHTFSDVLCSILYDRQDKEATLMSTDRSMHKEVVVYIYNHSAIKRNKLRSVLVKCMNLEPVIQSEVNHKENNKYNILTYIYIYIKSRKMVLMNLFVGSNRDTDIESTLVGTAGKDTVGQIERVALNM